MKVKRRIPAAVFLLYIVNMITTGCMPPPTGIEYPDFELKTPKGESVTLSSFRGKSIVVLGIGNPYT